ncbi:hypothetical protein CAP31_02485 [Sulfuriferula sp. AH1]|uniref:hypothetical protein n=1 Tax=Sulfuriferula sp. AH1 TaxID=1985873 RepID=UPI000B3B485B|nr:hypothetical protein [Sulfuriferula sp. AH1]ARU30654.1 hypothetical protein CAP31_02485 [Sulfuriferula sp. AH1]
MKISNFLIGLGLLLSSHVPALAGGLDDAKQLADAGSPQLALLQLDQGLAHASQDARPDWLRWQWQLLGKVGQTDDVLKRAAALPEDAPDDVKHTAALLAARAAIKKGDGSLARGYLAKLLWVLPSDKVEYQELRNLAVQSHLLPQPDGEAASVMLRYQQDFGVDVALLHIYALAMLQAGRATDVNWVRTQLVNNDPMAALIDAAGGQLSDDDSKQRLQAVLGSDASAPMLLVARKIAAQMNAPELQIQISEHLLNLTAAPDEASAPALWKAYRDLTQSFGNVRLLLFGSDAGWADLARESASTDPVMARAIWAYLARDGKDPALRSSAQQQFLEQLLAQHLDRAALRLFVSVWPGLPASAFNATVRYRLGKLALDAGEFELAAGLWHDLDAPAEGVDAADWQARRAALYARLHDWPSAAKAVSAWLTGLSAVPSASGWQMLAVVQQLSRQASEAASARDLLTRLLPVVEPLQRRAVLYRLGQLAAADKQPAAAAQWYLQAATEMPQADAMTVQSRLDAAASLEQAGLHEDAGMQYQWVLKNSTDAAQQAAASYALSLR